MRAIEHPLSGAVYDLEADGTVRVTARDGRIGRFDHHGVWISGAVKHADPQLCLWIGGRELPTRAPVSADSSKRTGSIPSEELTQ